MTSKKMGVYESFIHKSRYARYLRDEGRREIWEETVQRLQDSTNETDKIVYKLLLTGAKRDDDK